MPIHSQHTAMSFDEWERLPRPPGWKYEYYDGCAHVRPNYQYAVTTLTVTPRSVVAPCVLRPASTDDEASLLAVYLNAFGEDPVFCDYTEEQFLEAAQTDLRESFSGRRAPALPASRVALATETEIVGAALLSYNAEYGPMLNLLFVRHGWRRRGVATALISSVMNALSETGETTLTSCYHLANNASQAWHRAFGFVEKPDLRYAQAYERFAQQELWRCNQSEGLAAADAAALDAELRYWEDQVEALERLADEQGYRAVAPRLPHH